MSEWIDIDECVKLSGKSVATVRRAIKRLPVDSIKKDGAKHLYERAVILHELGVDRADDTALPASITDTVTIEHDTINDRADDTPLIEALREQIAMQGEQLKEKQSIIEQLLERQREQNLLLGQLRLLTTAKPDTIGKTERELQHERIALIVAVVIVLCILAVIVWVSWHR